MHYFILRDITINTSASPTTKSVNEYLNILNSNSIISIIKFFTRVTESFSSIPIVVYYDLTQGSATLGTRVDFFMAHQVILHSPNFLPAAAF